MKLLFYRFLTTGSMLLGAWFVGLFAWIISTFYFIAFRQRRKTSIDFYRRLFPHKTAFHHFLTAWRQYHEFAHLYVQRLLWHRHENITLETTGWEHIEAAEKTGQGAILLMSHLGNWEIAASSFTRYGLKLMIFMAIKQQEQIEKQQKHDLHSEGVQIMAAAHDQSAAFNLLEASRFMQGGGFVSLAGDRTWTEGQRTVPVRFVGQEVLFPASPHALALVSGSPLIVFFSYRVGKNSHHVTIYPPRYVKRIRGISKEAVIQSSAQDYADKLEAALRLYPEQWGCFEPLPRNDSEIH